MESNCGIIGKNIFFWQGDEQITGTVVERYINNYGYTSYIVIGHTNEKLYHILPLMIQKIIL